MTEQEIEKLREKLGSDYSVKRQNGAITVELVGIWKGVEFAECLNWVKGHGVSFVEGQIYPLTTVLSFCCGHNSIELYGREKDDFKPSTESAYVEQLKAKARELYGEIKDGDRFDLSMFGEASDCTIYLYDRSFFAYHKNDDSLWFSGFPIYHQGKWAKKVERVNVEVTNLSSSMQAYSLHRFYNIQFKTSDISTPYNLSDISAHLAKCLEDYLNKS